jgi:UDP-glucose 4-epimerase
VFVKRDYCPTRDGRVHLDDLADAHLAALAYLETHDALNVSNFGNGHGFSMIKILNAANKVIGRRRTALRWRSNDIYR